MFSKDSVVTAVFLIVGTVWWLAVGYVGWRSTKEKVGRTFCWISGVIVLLVSVPGILFSIGMLFEDIQGKRLEVVLFIQEFLVALLWSGALVSSLLCFMAAATDISSSSSAIAE
jgi:hypothetical protein